MKPGKISESILKRSVLKQIKQNREEITRGAAVGADCALFHMQDTNTTGLAVGSATGNTAAVASLAIYRATNNLAAGGIRPVAVMLHLMLPPAYFESDLKDLMAEAQNTADKLELQIAGGQTETIEDLKVPLVSVNAIGVPMAENRERSMFPEPGDHIVMTKWIGISGTEILAREKEAELSQQYPLYFIKEAQALKQYYSVIPEAATAVKSGVSMMHDIAGGGIFGALWEMGECTGVGLTISLKKIPVKQETIEVCEFFDINPYELRSDGALLMVAKDGYALCEELSAQGIMAAVIGTVTDSNDRVVMNDDEKRFLEPPKTDELYKIL